MSENAEPLEEFDKQMGVNIWDNPLDLPALFHKKPPDIEWFIKDVLIAGRGAVTSGIGGSSKSTLIRLLAVGAVLGRLLWDWTVCKTGRALLVMTEDTADEAFRSIYYTCKAMGLTDDEKRKVYEGLKIYPLAGEDVILLKKSTKNTLENSPLFESLVKKIQSMGDCVFCGLDPALSLTDGDELDQGHQRRLGKMCDNLAVLTGSTVMLVAHAPKNSKDEITSHNSRGGGALVDAVRTEFVMRTMTPKEAKSAKIIDQEERQRHVQLVAVKGNFLPPAAYAPVWLRRDDYGVMHGADVSFDDTDMGPCASDMEAFKVLSEMCENGTKPRLIEWRKKLIEVGIIGNAATKTQETIMERIKNRLYDNGLIRSPKRGYWEPDPVQPGGTHDFNDA